VFDAGCLADILDFINKLMLELKYESEANRKTAQAYCRADAGLWKGGKNMKIAKLQSDYSPDTFMRIVKTDDSDISLAIYGKDEMKIAGVNGGGWLYGKKKIDIISAFDRIIDILNNKEESQ
jgi:hypothetical protein